MLVILNDTFANASKMPLIKLINYIIIGFYRSLINYEPKQKLYVPNQAWDSTSLP